MASDNVRHQRWYAHGRQIHNRGRRWGVLRDRPCLHQWDSPGLDPRHPRQLLPADDHHRYPLLLRRGQLHQRVRLQHFVHACTDRVRLSVPLHAREPQFPSRKGQERGRKESLGQPSRHWVRRGLGAERARRQVGGGEEQPSLVSVGHH